MKLKIRYSILFILAVYFLAAQDTITIYFNKEGVLTTDKNLASSYRKAVKDDNGMWKAHDYYMNNKSEMTGTYTSRKLNIRQGSFVYFFESGKKKSAGECINDKYEGLWEFWHENGAKHGEGRFFANQREGTWTYWHENGEKKSEGRYLNNLRTGTWKFWNEAGQLDFEENYQNGKVSSIIWYHENGAKKTRGYFSDEKKTGEWTYWNIDEKVYLKASYLNGVQNGEWVRNFENAESMRIYYENGVNKDKKLGGIIRRE